MGKAARSPLVTRNLQRNCVNQKSTMAQSLPAICNFKNRWCSWRVCYNATVTARLELAAQKFSLLWGEQRPLNEVCCDALRVLVIHEPMRLLQATAKCLP